jgi:hypothetical protein
MIKYKHDCEVKNIEYELKMQLDYDPNCKVIAIMPTTYKTVYTSLGSSEDRMVLTHVNIIWDSK